MENNQEQYKNYLKFIKSLTFKNNVKTEEEKVKEKEYIEECILYKEKQKENNEINMPF